MIHVIVAGRRYFNDYEFLCAKLDKFFADKDKTLYAIVNGTARGIDTLGGRYGDEHGIKVIPVEPEWDKYNKYEAPKVRNRAMANISQMAIIFWDEIKKGGTWDMIQVMHAQNKPLIIYRIKKDL